jgi:hypothetical protein
VRKTPAWTREASITMLNPTMKTPEPMTLRAPRTEYATSVYESATQQMASHPRDELACVMTLLRVPTWMAGLHSDEKMDGMTREPTRS